MRRSGRCRRRGAAVSTVFRRGPPGASPEGAIGPGGAGHGPTAPASPGVRLGRAALVVPGGGLAARLHAELVEDVGDVALDRVRAEVVGARDQLVAVAGGDELEDVELARAERLGGDEDRRA